MIQWLIDNYVVIAVWCSIIGLGIGLVAAIILVILKMQFKREFKRILNKVKKDYECK